MQLHDDDLSVEILTPPFFTRSGIIKKRTEAWKTGEWYGTFNLWILQNDPTPAIMYQLRSPTMGWAPNKLDVAVAGHYEDKEPDEEIGVESKEELGKEYPKNDMTSIGRRLNVGIGKNSTVRNTVSDIYLVTDNSKVNTFVLQEEEVYALCVCPIDELIKVHTGNYSFNASARKFDGTDLSITVNKEIFPDNWDNYHYKMTLLIKRYFDGEKNLIY